MHATPSMSSTTSRIWASTSLPSGAPRTVASVAMRGPTFVPNQGRLAQSPAASRSPPKPGFWPEHKRNSSSVGKTSFPSPACFKFPDRLHGVDWADTRTMWRVFCNRSPSDSPPNINADPCPCGLSLNSSHHLLRDCSLLATKCATLLRSATGDIQTASFIIPFENTQPICRYLQATGLGHSTCLCFEKDDDSTIDGANDTSSRSPEPDFGTFEPWK